MSIKILWIEKWWISISYFWLCRFEFPKIQLWITCIQVKGPSKPLTTEQLIELLSDPRNKDPAKLGNIASNVFASMDRETVDVDKVSPLPSTINPLSPKSFFALFSQDALKWCLDLTVKFWCFYTSQSVSGNEFSISVRNIWFILVHRKTPKSHMFIQKPHWSFEEKKAEKYRQNFSQLFQHF